MKSSGKKLFNLLLIACATIFIFSCTAFTDVKDLFPFSVVCNNGMYKSELTKNDAERAKSLIDAGKPVGELDIVSVNTLKTRIEITVPSGVSVTWNKKGETQSEKVSSGVKYTNVLALTKDDKIIATLSNGTDSIQYQINVKIQEPTEKRVFPTYFELYRYKTGKSYTVKPKITYMDGDYSIDTSVQQIEVQDFEPGEKLDLIVKAPEGMWYNWTSPGKVIREYDHSMNSIMTRVDDIVRCAITDPSTRIEIDIEFILNINNHFVVTCDDAVNVCKGDSAKVNIRIEGKNLENVVVKGTKVPGTGFKFVKTSVKPNEIIGYVTFTPDYMARLKMYVTDSYANEEYPDCSIKLTDHVMTNWKVVKKSTIFEKGLKTATCKYCKRKIEYPTAKLQATISMPTAKKIKVGQKIRMQVKLTSGDYISAFSVTKDGKTTVAKVTKGPNYVWIKGLKKGNAVLKVRTKAGKTASCKLTVY